MSVRNLLAYLPLIFGGYFYGFAQSASLPAAAAQLQLSLGDSLHLKAQGDKVWCRLLPEKAVYDNLSDGVDTRHPLRYRLTRVEEWNFEPTCGTRYYGLFPEGNIPDGLLLDQPPFTKNHIWQVSVRRDNTYLGYLTELLGLPFVIPPRYLPGFGHQTDLRLGTDCAALAIYGRRRMGERILYRGPRGISASAQPTQEVYPGVLLHFGFQVSVLYEDRGRKGVIDPADLLIHTYENSVRIEALGDTQLWGQEFRLFSW